MCSIINESNCYEEKEGVALHRLKIRQTDQRLRSQEESLRSEDGMVLARGESGRA